MINLSQLARESNRISFWEKVKSLRYDIYLAENIRDYLENAPEIRLPLYKRCFFGCDMGFYDKIYISIMNVKLERIKINNLETDEKDNWFLIHDDTGKDVVYWIDNEYFFPSSNSFEELQEREGLKEGDWIYDILLRYLIKQNLPTVIKVRKYNFSNKKREKKFILDKVKGFLPDYKPLPQTVS